MCIYIYIYIYIFLKKKKKKKKKNSRKVSYELSNSLTNALALYNELVNLWNKKVLKNEETNQPEIPINSYLYSTSVNIIKNLYESLKKKLTEYLFL